MSENKRNSNETRDYKERFEFRLTFGSRDTVICGRYFKINNFNPMSVRSLELKQVMEYWADQIDKDLKEKTQVYLELVSPRIFKNMDEMKEYFKNPYHREDMRLGEGIVLMDSEEPNYVWGGANGPQLSPTQFSDGEFSNKLTDEDYVEYKLTFIDHGKFMNSPREVCSVKWTGVYPRYIRKSIDLSNRGPVIEKPGDLYTLGFDGYLKYKLTEGKTDLVFKIIRDIYTVCTYSDSDVYTISADYAVYGKREREADPSLPTKYITYRNIYSGKKGE